MITGTPDEILALYRHFHPELELIEQQARRAVRVTSKAVYPYQAAALYHLACDYDGGRALEIGTSYGYSGFYLAMAMPTSPITTLNTEPDEVKAARQALDDFKNMEVVEYASWDYFSVTGKFRREYSFIFVDGDHKQIKRDLPWFNRLSIGGLIVFHDYSPKSSSRPCPPVFRAINWLAGQFDRPPDVLIVDCDKVGLAGFIRRAGEVVEV